jgi:hypothetical protein
MQQCHCWSFDISEGGMGLISPYEVELDETVELEFSLPGATAPLKLLATIRSKVGFRLGCEFISPTDTQKQEIVGYGKAFQSPRSS